MKAYKSTYPVRNGTGKSRLCMEFSSKNFITICVTLQKMGADIEHPTSSLQKSLLHWSKLVSDIVLISVGKSL